MKDENIYSQLLHGVRYLDLRAAFYRRQQPQFWINHAVFRMNPMVRLLQQIRDFVRETNEIVIVDFHGFEVGIDLDFEIHNQLVHLIKRELGDLMAPPSLTWNATMKDVWLQKKTIILSYNHPYVTRFDTLLWPGVMHQWGNVQKLSDLEAFLEQCSRSNLQ